MGMPPPDPPPAVTPPPPPPPPPPGLVVVGDVGDGDVVVGDVLVGDVVVGAVVVGVVLGGVEVGGVVVGGVVVGGVVVGGVVVGGVVVGGVVVGGVVVGGGWMTQRGLVIVLVSRVTAPFRARTLPATVLPVSRDADCSAMMVPTKVVLVSRVAELPTCQKTLHGWAPLMSATVLFGAVMSVEPTWKMKTALALPLASSVTVPVIPSGPAAL